MEIQQKKAKITILKCKNLSMVFKGGSMKAFIFFESHK